MVLKDVDSRYHDRIANIMKEFEGKRNQRDQQISNLKLKKNNVKKMMNTELENKKISHLDGIEQMKLSDIKKILFEQQRFEQYQKTCEVAMQRLKEENKNTDSEYTQRINDVVKQYDNEAKNKTQRIEELLKERESILATHKLFVQALEEDAEAELLADLRNFSASIQKERKLSHGLKDENDLLRQKYDDSMKAYKDHKETVSNLQEKQTELLTTIKGLNDDKKLRENSLQEMNREDLNIEKRMNELSIQNTKIET